MRRILLVVLAALLLCGFKSYIDANGLLHWYFNSDTDLYSSAGEVATIASASPPAAMIALPDSETEPFFVAPSANDALVGPYGLYTSPAVDNLVQRGSFESCDGSDHPVGWAYGSTGTGSVSADCDTAHKAEGSKAFRAEKTGLGTMYAVIISACIDIDDTKDYAFSAYLRGSSQDENVSIGMESYTDDSCSAGETIDYHWSGLDLTASWVRYAKIYASTGWGTTESVKIRIYLLGGSSDENAKTFIDSVNFYGSSSLVDSSCTCDTDATCSCSYVIPAIATPFTAGTWSFEATIQSAIDGAVSSPTRYIMYTPDTGGGANRIQLQWKDDSLSLRVNNSDAVLKVATVAAAGDSDTSYTVKAYHTDTGRIGVCWEGSCGTETTGATTGAPNATTYLGATNSAAGEIHVKDVVWRRRLTEPLGTTP